MVWLSLLTTLSVTDRARYTSQISTSNVARRHSQPFLLADTGFREVLPVFPDSHLDYSQKSTGLSQLSSRLSGISCTKVQLSKFNVKHVQARHA